MALKGTLKDFGIADIFQLIGQQQKTGVLHLKNRDEEVHIKFKDGNVVQAESAARQRKDLLGHMLVRAELISEPQLEAALDEQRRTLKRLGDILVGSGSLKAAQLKEMTHLQTTETLYRLFGWKQGSYEFAQGEVHLDADALAVRSESVLMEGFRRVDEWPSVRKVIASGRMTFEKLKDAPTEENDEEKGDDDLNLDAAFGEEDGDDEPKGGLGRMERRMLALYARGRTAEKYIDLARSGEFEACKALMNLCAQGYLKPIAPAGKDAGEVLGGMGQKTRRERAREVAGNAAMTVLLAAAVLLVVGQIDLGSMALGGLGDRRFVDPAAQRLLSQGQLERIRGALGVYVLEHGEPPEQLTQLSDERLLTPGDLQFPWSQRYHYRRTGSRSFVLLPPLR